MVEIDNEISDICVCVENNTKSSRHSSSWITDGETLVYITSNGSLFTSFTSRHHGLVKMRNGRVFKIVGIRNINLKTKCGEKLVPRNVRFVSRMKINIISIGKLDDEGYSCEFGSR